MDLDSPWGDVPSQSDNARDSPISPIKENKPSDSPSVQTSTTPAQSSSGPRTAASRKTLARKVGVQAPHLEAVDNSFDPLGPLGPLGGDVSEPPVPVSVDQGPTPPRKEGRPRGPASAAQTSYVKSTVDSADHEDAAGAAARQRGPPPVHTAAAGPARQQSSVSIEQAAKPSFDISVGDPHKVGDLTSSHIVYQVRTKTTSKAYKQQEFAVSRRYRDFLWLYSSLHNNNPGVVVPPPPEKQSMGRFDTNFVESRRQALERMLNKTGAHPILHHDADLKIFLESESFNIDVKNKENREPDLGQNKGMLSSLGINVGAASGKFVEHDDWFHDRKIYLDALENQLKALLKAIDMVVAQRKTLAEMAGDFSVSLNSLAAVELSPALSGPLAGLSDVQVRIRELYDRQAQQDVLTLGITLDEYIRLIGSIKQAFAQRQKAFHSWHGAESELAKRRSAHEKLLRQGRSQQDKLNEVGASVSDAEKRAHQARLLFDDMGRLMRGELERFEKEKVEDFKSGIETFLEGAVEAQKELIELWETFLMQLDAEENGEAPFYKPPPATTAEPEQDAATTSSKPSEEPAESSEAVARATEAALEADA